MYYKEKLEQAIEELKNIEDTTEHKVAYGRGNKQKWYTTVDTRLNVFRKYFGPVPIKTDIINQTSTSVVCKSSIVLDGVVVAEGIKEVFYGKGFEIEKCQTGSVGRALAILGLSGDELASGDEMLEVIERDKIKDSINIKDEKEFVKNVCTKYKTAQHHNQLNEFRDIAREIISQNKLGWKLSEQGINLLNDTYETALKTLNEQKTI
tara:strand:+ start:1874 stop:2494 length:621 start_codon:yes stop_codon:yes gene_type:complete